MNNENFLDRVPFTVRQTMAELLSEIDDLGQIRSPRESRSEQSERADRLQRLRIKVAVLFAEHFLPLIVPGAWRLDWHMCFECRDHDECGRRVQLLPVGLEHTWTFRRQGSRGSFTATNALAVTMPYEQASTIATTHGMTALFDIGVKKRRCHRLEADCRLNGLSWHRPGKTALIVLADPTLLTAGRKNLLGEEPSCFPRTTQFTGRLSQ